MKWLVELLTIEDSTNIIRPTLEKTGYYKLVEKLDNGETKHFLNHPKNEISPSTHSANGRRGKHKTLSLQNSG